MANKFLPVEVNELNKTRMYGMRKTLDEFVASSIQVAEFNWKEHTTYTSATSLLNTIRPIISKYGYPMSALKRGDKIYFVRKT